jgi:hypothetical protein
LLFGLSRAVPFLADAISYAVSFGTGRQIRGRFRPLRPAGRRGLWREVADGLEIVWQVPILRAVLITAPLVNFAFIGVIFTITLTLRQHGTSASMIGLVQAAVMGGGLLGAIAAPRLQGRLRVGTAAIVVTLAGSVLFCCAAVLIPSPLVALPVAGDLLLAPTVNAALFAVMLRTTPEEMRGRVSSTVVMVATTLATLAPLTAGLLVQHVSGAVAIGAFATAMAVAAVISLLLPGLRDPEPPRAPACPRIPLTSPCSEAPSLTPLVPQGARPHEASRPLNPTSSQARASHSLPAVGPESPQPFP